MLKEVTILELIDLVLNSLLITLHPHIGGVETSSSSSTLTRHRGRMYIAIHARHVVFPLPDGTKDL